VHLYTICWNEEFLLPYFFRHYDELVDRYVVFDNGSTDRTPEILAKHPDVDVRPFSTREGFDAYVLAAQQVHNQCWKESRGEADWVIVTAVDEFLYAPRLGSYLATCTRKGVTAVPALGFQMISRDLPSEDRSLLDLVRRGCPWPQMNKLSLFDPNSIVETNQGGGRHRAAPTGRVQYPKKDILLLLHYKFLSPEYTFKRQFDLYGWTRAEFDRRWAELERSSVPDVLDPGYDAFRPHPKRKAWWRGD